MGGHCEIPRSVLNAIVVHARVAAPAECCGVLLGAGRSVVDAVPAKNLSDRPNTRYVLDPRAHFEAQRRARDQGMAVVGFYHSHPYSEPRPSETDVSEAAYPGAVYLIAGLVSGASSVSAYTFVDGRFDELALDVVAG